MRTPWEFVRASRSGTMPRRLAPVASSMLPLVQILRAPPGHVAAALGSLSAHERGALLEQARGHGLGGVLLHECAGSPLAATEFGLALRRDAHSLAARAMRARALLVRTLAHLNDAGITPTPLKGVALSARLYGDPLMRATTDVDLLVRPEEVSAAEAVLTRMGLARYGTRATTDYARRHHHHLNFVGPGGMVELHFRPTSGFATQIPTDLFLDHSREGEFDGQAIRIPEPTRELLHLSVHAAQHLLARLGWLYDLKLLLLRAQVDWPLFVALARQTRLTVPAYVALRAAADAAAAPVPPSVFEALAPGVLRRRALAAVFAADPLVEGSPVRWVHPVLQKVFLCSSAGQMARLFSHHASWAAKRRVALRLQQLLPARWRAGLGSDV